jgi:hypothetical protein
VYAATSSSPLHGDNVNYSVEPDDDYEENAKAGRKKK